MPNGKRARGSGYWPTDDPAEGLDAHARYVMKRYKPWERRNPPREVLIGDAVTSWK